MRVMPIIPCTLAFAAINIQQLARKREERLGVLEYELRVAKEDLAEVCPTMLLSHPTSL